MADNAAAHGKLREMIERCRQLPVELVARSVPEIARALRDDIQRTAQAGTAPDGEPWQEKKDGTQALRGVERDVDVTFSGSVVIATLRGKFVRHHKRTARGGIRRQVIPTRKIPDAVTRAIGVTLRRHFSAIMGGNG